MLLLVNFLVLTALASVFAQEPPPTVSWIGKWAFACDFPGRNLTSLKVSGEDCGPKCAKIAACSHFVWSPFNGGTCWLKKGQVTQWDAVYTGDKAMVCGFSGTDIKINVFGTHHDGTEYGVCELPKAPYASPLPIALGNLDKLEELRFRPELCGQQLTVDCGFGAVDVVVITYSDNEGGIDMFPSAWDRVSGGKTPGQLHCTVFLSKKDMLLNTDKPQCYHSTGETNNDYWRKVILLNTRGNLVVGASLNGIEGTREGAYFHLSTRASHSDWIVFRYENGIEHTVQLGECLAGEKALWN